MLPFQTPSFDPSAPDLIQHVHAGQRLTDLYLGATAYLMGGKRWVSVNGYDYSPQGPKTLVYPLPESYGAEVIPAVQAFEKVLVHESVVLRVITPRLELAGPQPSSPIPLAPDHLRHRTQPRPRPVSLAGAVPLPGLEPWTGFGRLR